MEILTKPNARLLSYLEPARRFARSEIEGYFPVLKEVSETKTRKKPLFVPLLKYSVNTPFSMSGNALDLSILIHYSSKAALSG